MWPKLDFVIVPLEKETVEPILNAVIPGQRIVHDIIHVQIEKNGQLVLGAYDNFHRDCCVFHPGDVEELVDELEADGIIRSVRRT